MKRILKQVLRTAATALAAAPLLAMAQANYGECTVTPNPPVRPMATRVPDALTVAVPLPSPGAYNGNTPETINGGYMYCMVAEIANRAGGKKVVVKNASFESIVTGKGSDFDMSVWDILITDARKQAVDFSDPYRKADTGVLVRPNSDLTEDSIRNASVGSLLGSAQEKFIRETKLIDPQKLRLFQSNDDMWAALRSRQIDAVLTDTNVVMRAAKRMSLKVVGRYPAGGDIAALFPKGSKNVATVNQILDDMRKDGSLRAVEVKWLEPGLGGDPNAIPMWRAP
ncbi:ABC transporter substrate-binding protein [Ottowia sp.]|uniref:ABC transporter substrate-binding protein n=1 Tax=Ottowia sp. TaxID=1898956 RepID=UPI0039E4ABF3